MSDAVPAVVTAIPDEVAALGRRLQLGPEGGTKTRSGLLGGRRLLVTVTGDGSRRAARTLAEVLDRHEVASLLLMGVAGGLSPGLSPADLVTAHEVRDLETGEVIRAPGAPPARPAAALDGTVSSSTRIVWTREEKERVWRSLGAPRRAVVDLESAAWARVAGERGIPWRVVRAVSDLAEETLPMDFDRYRGPDGGVLRGRVLAAALARPRKLVALRRLKRRVALCAEALAGAVEEWPFS